MTGALALSTGLDATGVPVAPLGVLGVGSPPTGTLPPVALPPAALAIGASAVGGVDVLSLGAVTSPSVGSGSLTHPKRAQQAQMASERGADRVIERFMFRRVGLLGAALAGRRSPR